MKIISTQMEYDSMAIRIEKILDKTKELPENVFEKTLKLFLFITFDELFMPLFFNNLQRYLFETGENNFWLAVVNPNPQLYFGANFDFYGAIEFMNSDTWDSYISALNDYPVNSPADALIHNSNSLVFFSPAHNWVVYGDREAGIAICAFKDRWLMELFKSIYGSDLLDGVKGAADYAYGMTENSLSEKKFYTSYSVE